MQPDLIITTQTDFELYEHLNAACYELNRKKCCYLVTTIATILLGIYLGVTAYLDQDSIMLYIVMPIWMVILFTVSFLGLRTSTVAKRGTKRSIKNSNNPFAAIQYTFFPTYMTAFAGEKGVQTGYTTVTRLVETSKVYLIFATKSNAHCIKKSDLGPSNLNVFRQYMQDKTGLIFEQVKY